MLPWVVLGFWVFFFSETEAKNLLELKHCADEKTRLLEDVTSLCLIVKNIWA